MARFLGVTRAATFSPNSNDEAIMTAALSNIAAAGHAVCTVCENDLPATDIAADVILTMARSEQALQLLEVAEAGGAVVVNAPAGVRRCRRPVVTMLLERYGVALPRSRYVLTRNGVRPWHDLHFPCWLKRGDACAQQREDVDFVQTEAELLRALDGFRHRGIVEAVVSEHVEGDIVKFYGVAGTAFFHWHYPTLEGRKTKFGLEEINGPARQFPFDEGALCETLGRFALAVNTPVYGGDCIVDAAGRFYVIDFNDFPSFSCCSTEAARAIADYCLESMRQQNGGRH